MLNKNLFVGMLAENGYTQIRLSEELGCAQSNLNAKINGKREFRQSEISKIIKIFNLSPERVVAIFFSAKVE